MSNELTTQREVTLFYTQSNERKTLQSTARTWGDLSQELGENFSKSKVVLQESRLTLENTEAMLPSGAFTLFVFPRQSKAGMGVDNITKRNYHNGNFSPLRTFCKKMTGSSPNGKQACIDALDAHYAGSSKPAAKPAAKKKAVAKAKPIAKKAPAKPAAKPAPAKAKAKSVGSKVNEKVAAAKSNGGGMTDAQYKGVVSKLDTIISKIDAAMPNMNEKELNTLKDLASTVRGTMQTMK